MIVDCHTHVGEELHLTKDFVKDARTVSGNPNQRLAVDLQEHLKAMEVVERAVVLGFRAHHVGYVVPNEYVADYVHQHDDKLVGFASIDPHNEDAVEQLDYCVKNLCLKGLKLGPIYQNMHPSDPRFVRLFQRAEQLDIPILIHQGTTFCRDVSLEYANPVLLQPIARAFPNLRMIIAHLGHPWIGETISLIRKHPNLYSDLSALHYRPWQFYNALVLAKEYGVLHKLFLGSDYPVTTPQESIDGLRNVNAPAVGTGMPTISSEAIEEIIHRDTFAILGLS
jgi:predicted TIM-barrel fold metal-dependent hydrolase